MKRAFALVVAVQSYAKGSGLASLDGTVSRAYEFVGWLLKVRRADPRDVFLCTSPKPARLPPEIPRGVHTFPATREGIRSAAQRLVGRAPEGGADVFLYASGHGGRVNGSDVLMAADYRSHDGDKCIRLDELRNDLLLAMGPDTHYWFVEACRNEVDFRVGDLALTLRRSVKGKGEANTLFATAPGAPARAQSKFPQALLSSLRGDGRAKTWAEGSYWVTFPAVADVVRDAVQPEGMEIDAQPAWPPGRILQLPVVPDVMVSVDIRGARDGERYLLWLTGERPPIKRWLTWPEQQIHVPPGRYYVSLLRDGTEETEAISFPRETAIPIYEPVTLEFDCNTTAGPPGQGFTVFGPSAPTALLRVTQATGDTWLSAGTPRHFDPLHGPLSMQLFDRDEPVISLEHRGQRTLYSDEFLHGQFALSDLSERAPAEDVFDPDPALKLSLLAAAAIGDVDPYAPMLAGIPKFDGLTPAQASVYAMTPPNGGVMTVHSDLQSARLTLIEGLTPASCHAAVSAGPAEPHRVHLQIPGGDMVIPIVALAGRVTVIVVQPVPGAPSQSRRWRVHQFALEPGHLAANDPAVLLSAVRFSVLVQRRIDQERPAMPAEPDREHAQLWAQLLAGRWPDPLTMLLAAYELVRRGALTTDDRGALLNLIESLREYGTTFAADLAVLDALATGHEPRSVGEPLVLDGLIALGGEEAIARPKGMALDYRSAWTCWQAWPGKDSLPPLVLGAGDGRGFGGHVSPAELALADALDPAGDGFELRIHGVGGSSAEELLQQSETVQVGGDDIAQFVRRRAVARPTVRWPLEGYWWGGLTSRPSSRAFWAFLLPLTLCNLASWMLPAPRSRSPRYQFAGKRLPPVMRVAGYVLTLLLAASLATASIDVFGWQCAMAPKMRPANGQGSPVECLPGWLQRVAPAAAGPRLVVFALVPVLVLALIGYACHRTLRSYERWTMPVDLPEYQHQEQKAGGTAARPWSWPLTASGFWHGLRPVRRQQLLHLAGAAALVCLYLALVPAAHTGWRVFAVIAAVVLVVLPGLMLLSAQAGRPGVDPNDSKLGDMKWVRYDWWCTALLVVAGAALVTLLLARIWWRPLTPALPTGQTGPGLLPGDSWIWASLTFTMAALLIMAAALTALARNKATQRLGRAFRPFAAGFMGPLTLGLAFVTGGIFAAGLNLMLPNLLIEKPFQSTAPAVPGVPWANYPLRLPVPAYGFIFAFLGLAATTIVLAIAALVWGIRKWRKTRRTSHLGIFYKGGAEHWKADQQRHRIAFSWTKARLPSHLGVAVTALSLAGIVAVAVFDGLALAWNPATQSWLTLLAHAGQWLLLPAVAFLYGYTRQAYKDGGKRRQIGVLWDVGTFWPRASQPLAPPCYMERSVPETVNRLRRALGDRFRDRGNRGCEFKDRKNRYERTDPAADRGEEDYIREHIVGELGAAAERIVLPTQDWVLINGYSQGTPIAAAVIAQLPQELRDKVTLVTVGCPLRRLYGRAFPAYFGQDCLLDLAGKLTPGQPSSTDLEDAMVRVLPETRWWNLIRPSDYVGSYIFQDTMEVDMAEQMETYKNGDCLVDKRILDPPRIIPFHGTTPPPIHEHSDYWPDPQIAVHTHIAVDEARLQATPRAAIPDRLRLHQALAGAYMRLGNYRKALKHAEALLLYQEQALGADHPDTLATRASIAAWTGEFGDAPEALRLFNELLPDQERVLGADHPAVLATRASIEARTGHRDGPANL